MTIKLPLHVQAICANRVFAQTFWQCRVLFAQTACVKSKHFDIFCASSQCLRRLAQTNLSISRSWHRVVVPAVVICSRLTTLCLPKGEPKKRQFSIEFIEEYRSLPALLCVTSTEYRNKKNEQNAKLLNKYKEKYLNVEKIYLIQEINSIRACSRKEVKKFTQ